MLRLPKLPNDCSPSSWSRGVQASSHSLQGRLQTLMRCNGLVGAVLDVFTSDTSCGTSKCRPMHPEDVQGLEFFLPVTFAPTADVLACVASRNAACMARYGRSSVHGLGSAQSRMTDLVL